MFARDCVMGLLTVRQGCSSTILRFHVFTVVKRFVVYSCSHGLSCIGYRTAALETLTNVTTTTHIRHTSPQRARVA